MCTFKFCIYILHSTISMQLSSAEAFCENVFWNFNKRKQVCCPCAVLAWQIQGFQSHMIGSSYPCKPGSFFSLCTSCNIPCHVVILTVARRSNPKYTHWAKRQAHSKLRGTLLQTPMNKTCLCIAVPLRKTGSHGRELCR